MASSDPSAAQSNSRSLRAGARDGSTSRLGPLDDATVISSAHVPPVAPASSAVSGAVAAGSSAEIGQRLQGTMLGPYRLDSFIGGGGMGAVFRALDTTLDRTVAVKVLVAGQADDEEMLRRFRNEAQSAARLDHENIGRVFAVGSDEGWHYIVFEFIEGRNLRDLISEQGPFDLGRTVDVAIQVADALEHASRRDVVHRDIKPSNIVITPEGRARIVDMGLARLHHLEGERDLTVSGVTLGTFDYISPEQARDSRTVDARSDLYSLGCTMFFMLTGRPPFAEGSMVQKLLQHQQERPPAIEALRPDVPRAFGGILERLMEKDPAARYQRPADLVADLIAFAETQGHVVTGPRVPAAAAPPRPARRPAARLPWLVPLLGLGATVAALWYQAAAIRTRPAPATTEQPADEGGLPSAAPAIRVGASVADAAPDAAAVAADLRAAIDSAVDGDVIEVAFTGVVDMPPIVLGTRRLTLRAAAGTRPTLRFTSLADAGGDIEAACHVGGGRLTMQGVAFRLAARPATGRRSALFVVSTGSLTCIDSLLVMSDGSDAAAATEPDAVPAFVAVPAAAPPVTGCGVAMDRSWACGDAVFLDAAGAAGGRIEVSWRGGGLLSDHPFVMAAGADGAGEGLLIDAALTDAVFACRSAAFSLQDSLVRPVPPRLHATATACEFLLDGGPLIVQSGVQAVSAYAAAVIWRDQASRYSGSELLRRVEAAAERLDIMFRDQPAGVRHAPRVSAWPDAAAWESAWASGGG